MDNKLGYIIDLPKIFDPRGNLTVAEGGRNVPFDIRRAYWVYDVRVVRAAAVMPISNVLNLSLP